MNRRLNKLFLVFVVSLLAGSDAFAQKRERKHKHKPDDTTANIFWSKLLWRTLDLTDINSNTALLCLYDTMGNKMNFNQVIAKELKNHTIKAYDISQNFKSMDTAAVRINDDGHGFDTWVYDDAGYKEHRKDSSLRQKNSSWQKNNWQKMDEINDPSPDTSNKYFIVEGWTSYGDTGKITATINWIGPYGRDDSGGLKPLFAIRYEDLAPLLGYYTLWQPCKKGTSFSCYDFFEARWFSSRIIKVAYDRPFYDVLEY